MRTHSDKAGSEFPFVPNLEVRFGRSACRKLAASRAWRQKGTGDWQTLYSNTRMMGTYMSLLDALSGRILRWNKMKVAALDRVCKGLKPFVSSRLDEYPDARDVFTDVCNNLFAYYLAASGCISRLLDSEFQQHKERFFSLNADLYLRFISAFHATHATLAYSSPQQRSLLYLISDGIVEMYNRPEGYMRRWWSHVGPVETGEPGAVLRVADHLYDEISPILGLCERDAFFGPAYWIEVQREFSRTMADLYSSVNWAKGVEDELTAH